jgi:hypothetical protein
VFGYSLRRQRNKLHVTFPSHPFSLWGTWYQLGRLTWQFEWDAPLYRGLVALQLCVNYAETGSFGVLSILWCWICK